LVRRRSSRKSRSSMLVDDQPRRRAHQAAAIDRALSCKHVFQLVARPLGRRYSRHRDAASFWLLIRTPLNVQRSTCYRPAFRTPPPCQLLSSQGLSAAATAPVTMRSRPVQEA
jgi:hypothetical protein